MPYVIVLFFPMPVDLWEGEWISLGASPVTAGDVEVWPHFVCLLVKLSASLGTLQWPAAAAAVNSEGGAASFVEILIYNQLWAERLDLEKAVPWYRRPGREISVSAVPFGPAQIFGALVGSWGHFFAPCVHCLVELAGLSLVTVVLSIAGFGTLLRFREFLELIDRFEFDFRRCDIFFERFEFLVCFKSVHVPVAAHVPVLWPVSTHTITFRMLLCP